MGSLGGYIARAFYYPSILLNYAGNKITGHGWFNRINDTIVLGAIPMSFMTEYLRQENIKGVISLNEDYELKYIYNTEDAWKSSGIKTLRLPTQDLFATPSLDKINRAINFIDNIKNENGSVYVHCKAGKTRSTTIVVCYLISSEGMTPQQAYSYVKQKRPQVWLRKTQLDTIEEYYQKELLKDTRTDFTS